MLQNALVLKALSIAFYASLIRIPSTYFKKGHVSNEDSEDIPFFRSILC